MIEGYKGKGGSLFPPCGEWPGQSGYGLPCLGAQRRGFHLCPRCEGSPSVQTLSLLQAIGPLVCQ